MCQREITVHQQIPLVGWNERRAFALSWRNLPERPHLFAANQKWVCKKFCCRLMNVPCIGLVPLFHEKIFHIIRDNIFLLTQSCQLARFREVQFPRIIFHFRRGIVREISPSVTVSRFCIDASFEDFSGELHNFAFLNCSCIHGYCRSLLWSRVFDSKAAKAFVQIG